jgi:large repetitive protein
MRARFSGFRRALVGGIAVAACLVVAGTAAAVTVTSFTPTSGLALTPADGSLCPGGTIAISGSGFVEDGPTSSVSVTFNGAKSPSVSIGSNNTVFAIVPTDATTGPITVTTAAGSASSPTPFTVNLCPYTTDTAAQVSVPVLNKFKPTSGRAGTLVAITGTSLTGTFKVTIGGIKAKFTKTGPNVIVATVPLKAKTGKIAVSNPAGTATTSATFKITTK